MNPDYEGEIINPSEPTLRSPRRSIDRTEAERRGSDWRLCVRSLSSHSEMHSRHRDVIWLMSHTSL